MPKIKTVPIDYMKAWQFKPRKSGLFKYVFLEWRQTSS